MSTKDNKAVARYFIEQLWNQRNLNIVDVYLGVNHIDHTDYTLGSPPGLPSGPAGFRWLVWNYLLGFPDIYATIEAMIAKEDEVVTRVTWRGTHTEDLMGIPPTGKQIEVTGISMHRIVDYTILESWDQFNATGVLRQIGAIVPPQLILRDAPQPHPVVGPWPHIPCDSNVDCPPGYVCRNSYCGRK